jgi:hypothetical protein
MVSRLSGLSPNAHGTLQAPKELREIGCFEGSVAHELAVLRYAERMGDRLTLSEKGRKFVPFTTAPTASVTQG